MNWEQLTAWLDKVSNNPLVITLTGILTVVVSVFVFLSGTSIGRRAIIQLTRLYNLGDQKSADTLKKVQDVEILAKERIEALEAENAEKIEELKADYEQKACALISICNFYVESLFELADLIPNAKVKAKIVDLKAQYEEKKEQITNVVGIIYQDYTSALEKSEAQIRKEYDEKVEYLENQINEIDLFFTELKEAHRDGSEETENSDPIEETIQNPVEGV